MERAEVSQNHAFDIEIDALFMVGMRGGEPFIRVNNPDTKVSITRCWFIEPPYTLAGRIRAAWTVFKGLRSVTK